MSFKDKDKFQPQEASLKYLIIVQLVSAVSPSWTFVTVLEMSPIKSWSSEL